MLRAVACSLAVVVLGCVYGMYHIGPGGASAVVTQLAFGLLVLSSLCVWQWQMRKRQAHHRPETELRARPATGANGTEASTAPGPTTSSAASQGQSKKQRKKNRKKVAQIAGPTQGVDAAGHLHAQPGAQPEGHSDTVISPNTGSAEGVNKTQARVADTPLDVVNLRFPEDETPIIPLVRAGAPDNGPSSSSGLRSTETATLSAAAPTDPQPHQPKQIDQQQHEHQQPQQEEPPQQQGADSASQRQLFPGDGAGPGHLVRAGAVAAETAAAEMVAAKAAAPAAAAAAAQPRGPLLGARAVGGEGWLAAAGIAADPPPAGTAAPAAVPDTADGIVPAAAAANGIGGAAPDADGDAAANIAHPPRPPPAIVIAAEPEQAAAADMPALADAADAADAGGVGTVLAAATAGNTADQAPPTAAAAAGVGPAVPEAAAAPDAADALDAEQKGAATVAAAEEEEAVPGVMLAAAEVTDAAGAEAIADGAGTAGDAPPADAAVVAPLSDSAAAELLVPGAPATEVGRVADDAPVAVHEPGAPPAVDEPHGAAVVVIADPAPPPPAAAAAAGLQGALAAAAAVPAAAAAAAGLVVQPSGAVAQAATAAAAAAKEQATPPAPVSHEVVDKLTGAWRVVRGVAKGIQASAVSSLTHSLTVTSIAIRVARSGTSWRSCTADATVAASAAKSAAAAASGMPQTLQTSIEQAWEVYNALGLGPHHKWHASYSNGEQQVVAAAQQWVGWAKEQAVFASFMQQYIDQAADMVRRLQTREVLGGPADVHRFAARVFQHVPMQPQPGMARLDCCEPADMVRVCMLAFTSSGNPLRSHLTRAALTQAQQQAQQQQAAALWAALDTTQLGKDLETAMQEARLVVEARVLAGGRKDFVVPDELQVYEDYLQATKNWVPLLVAGLSHEAPVPIPTPPPPHSKQNPAVFQQYVQDQEQLQQQVLGLQQQQQQQQQQPGAGGGKRYMLFKRILVAQMQRQKDYQRQVQGPTAAEARNYHVALYAFLIWSREQKYRDHTFDPAGQ